MTYRMVSVALWAGALGLVSGCEPGKDPAPAPGRVDEQGLRMLVAVGSDTGVTGIKFELTPVACGEGTPVGPPLTVERPLADVLAPAGLPQLENAPLDPGSKHQFAQLFQMLAPGCYDVTTTPLTTGMVTCTPAHARKVEVTAGKTTEVVLINQCPSMSPGEVDVTSLINRAPRILELAFPSATFARTCQLEKVCVTADDPDGNPLEIVWSAAAAPAHTPLAVLSREVKPDGSVTECVTLIPHGSGRIEAKVTVYDQLLDGGTPRRIEDWLAAHGSSATSNASRDFPIFVTAGRTPFEETCDDGLDNDCDGLTDRADTGDCTPACAKKFDVTMLIDLSSSTDGSLPSVKGIVAPLFDVVNARHPDTPFGCASFVDRPFPPFGTSRDHVFQVVSYLTTRRDFFTSPLVSLSPLMGGGPAEAQLEALALLARNDMAIGRTPGSTQVVVLSTDGLYHKAGDCTPAVGGCTSPNNGDRWLDPLEDYSSVADVKAAIQAARVIPVFLVREIDPFEPTMVAAYTVLARELGFPGNVLPLSHDGTSLQRMVLEIMEKVCATP